MDAFAFTLASLALLATPGPTNTLLFTSGALAGFQRSLALLFAELLGYLLSISMFIAVLGQILDSHDGLRLALKAACAGYLIVAARSLWMRGEVNGHDAVGLDKVFVTTLLNPKAFIFASAIIPGDPMAGIGMRLPWLAALSLIIVSVGAGWIGAGAAMKRAPGGWLRAQLCRRAGAAALVAFAALLSWSAVASALSLYAALPD
jgi:threonine/homoserine/homoserine lactone efflux protein